MKNKYLSFVYLCHIKEISAQPCKYFCWAFLLVCILNTTGCLVFPHMFQRYNSLYKEDNSNVSLFIDHNGGYPRRIKLQISLDGSEVCKPPAITRRSETINALDIRVEKGIHNLHVRVMDIEVESDIEFEISEKPLYFLIEYENIEDQTPTIKVRKIDCPPAFV